VSADRKAAAALERAPVAADLLATVLRPYKPHCRYLLEASIEHQPGGSFIDEDGVALVSLARGEFAIPRSCYIDDTGHLNAVEFNICYNQILYAHLASLIVQRITPAMRHFTLERFKERHLPDVLIHSIQSTYKRPIDPRRFQGKMAITEAVNRRKFVYFKTRCAFWDDDGGKATGEISVVFLNHPKR
jgi:hypothetical protein